MASLHQRGLEVNIDQTGGMTAVDRFICDTLKEALAVTSDLIEGIPLETRKIKQLNDGPGRFEALLTYKGIQAQPPQNLERWSCRLSFREEPIETHPQFATLLKLYEGTVTVDERGAVSVSWPQYLKNGGGGGFFGGGSNGKTPNPMYGAKTYPVLSAEAEHEYLRFSKPSSLMSQIGQVLPQLDTAAGLNTPNGYVWVRLCPEWETYGIQAWRIREKFELYPAGSYVPVVQSVAQSAMNG